MNDVNQEPQDTAASTPYAQAAAEALAESVRSTVDGMEQVLRMGDCCYRRVVLFETKNCLRDALLKYQAACAETAAQVSGVTTEQTVEDAAVPETPEPHTAPTVDELREAFEQEVRGYQFLSNIEQRLVRRPDGPYNSMTTEDWFGFFMAGAAWQTNRTAAPRGEEK